MTCYKGRAYCCAKDCAKFARCDRAFTEEVKRKAAEAKLDVAYAPKLECYEKPISKN